MSDKIMSVFGQFAVDLGEGPILFATEAEASTALVEFEKGAEYRDLAAAYCAYAGIDGKNAKGKANVITAFLTWVEAGSPAPAAKEDEAGETQF